ncbi:MAG: D-alanyl-D-alanine carboxypeptidase [Phycisphaerales bacterium]|nr:D-alanyl-D-alanine carboxypeptidase [Phycisphaerales bacterium]
MTYRMSKHLKSSGTLFVLLVALISSGCATTPAPTTAPATARIDSDPTLASRLDPILLAPGATISARIIELPSGRELYAREADRPMIPASNLKLVTTATALDALGPDRTFPTRLALAGDDLYLIGSGDPGLGDSVITGWAKLKPLDHFAPFAKALRDRGLTHLKGNLYYDDRAFDDQWILPAWSKSFREFWYGAPVAGLNFNDNCIDVTVHPTAPGELVTYDVLPPTAAIKIVNNCLTGDKQTPSIKRGSDPNEYILSGTCSTPSELASKPVENPGHFTADALRTYLAGKGITIDGKILRAPEKFSNQGQVIATTSSATMTTLIKRLNKSSQNFFAEALAKQSGEQYRQQHPDFTGTSWQAGNAAAALFLTRNHIANADVLRAVDGSGLARENRVTARMLTDLLAVMQAHPQAQAFRDSLPVAGVDGTLKKRLTDLKGKVQAKTGSIGRVRALSGYATTQDGRTLAFSLLCNDIQGDEETAVKRMDDAIRALLK